MGQVRGGGIEHCLPCYVFHCEKLNKGRENEPTITLSEAIGTEILGP